MQKSWKPVLAMTYTNIFTNYVIRINKEIHLKAYKSKNYLKNIIHEIQ